MATDYRISGIHALNAFVKSRLYSENILNQTKYKLRGADVSPFLPAQQVPQFTESLKGVPFIVYNYGDMPNEEYWIKNQQGVYVLYGDQEEEVRKMYNFIVDLLSDMDGITVQVNDSLTGPFADLDFKFISVTSAQGPEPYAAEGGRQAATIVFRMRYAQ